MTECANLQTRFLGANHPDTLFSSRALTEWQIEESKISSSAASDSATIKRNETDRIKHHVMLNARSQEIWNFLLRSRKICVSTELECSIKNAEASKVR